ncbi:MAG: hypothetical protein U9Q39_06960, partial [Pseudomonadota bacterium]|nr:hypothetical protein [Pseudomonadota bacterium]
MNKKLSLLFFRQCGDIAPGRALAQAGLSCAPFGVGEAMLKATRFKLKQILPFFLGLVLFVGFF